MNKFNFIRMHEEPRDKDNPPRVKLESQFRHESIIIPFTSKPGSVDPVGETAEKYLTEKGHKIIGFGVTENYAFYIISETFKTII